MLTRSTFGLLAVIFHKFVREIWPLIDVRIVLPLIILRNSGLTACKALQRGYSQVL